MGNCVIRSFLVILQRNFIAEGFRYGIAMRGDISGMAIGEP